MCWGGARLDGMLWRGGREAAGQWASSRVQWVETAAAVFVWRSDTGMCGGLRRVWVPDVRIQRYWQRTAQLSPAATEPGIWCPLIAHKGQHMVPMSSVPFQSSSFACSNYPHLGFNLHLASTLPFGVSFILPPPPCPCFWCRSQHVVAFLGACVGPQEVVILTEFCSGGTLWDALHTKPNIRWYSG